MRYNWCGRIFLLKIVALIAARTLQTICSGLFRFVGRYYQKLMRRQKDFSNLHSAE
jgi:hypothetical protein